jgi:hypothetical protein
MRSRCAANVFTRSCRGSATAHGARLQRLGTACGCVQLAGPHLAEKVLQLLRSVEDLSGDEGKQPE